MNHCPKCGAEYEGRFCDRCGTAADSVWRCPHCNEPVRAGAQFCSACGRSLNTETQSAPESKALPLRRASYVPSVLGVLFAVFLPYLYRLPVLKKILPFQNLTMSWLCSDECPEFVSSLPMTARSLALICGIALAACLLLPKLRNMELTLVGKQHRLLHVIGLISPLLYLPTLIAGIQVCVFMRNDLYRLAFSLGIVAPVMIASSLLFMLISALCGVRLFLAERKRQTVEAPPTAADPYADNKRFLRKLFALPGLLAILFAVLMQIFYKLDAIKMVLLGQPQGRDIAWLCSDKCPEFTSTLPLLLPALSVTCAVVLGLCLLLPAVRQHRVLFAGQHHSVGVLMLLFFPLTYIPYIICGIQICSFTNNDIYQLFGIVLGPLAPLMLGFSIPFLLISAIIGVALFRCERLAPDARWHIAFFRDGTPEQLEAQDLLKRLRRHAAYARFPWLRAFAVTQLILAGVFLVFGILVLKIGTLNTKLFRSWLSTYNFPNVLARSYPFWTIYGEDNIIVWLLHTVALPSLSLFSLLLPNATLKFYDKWTLGSNGLCFERFLQYGIWTLVILWF